MAKTRELITAVQQDLDNYDSYLASARVRDFAEVLTNWYIRRSRDRFWEGDKDAFDTLYTVLEAVLRSCAPLLPLTTEEMWRGLTGGRSVHLESWPDADEFPADEALVRDMDAIREAASVALSLRKSAGLRVRLPLSELTLAVQDADTIGAYADLIADELNVKSVRVVEASDEIASEFGLSKALTINARALGPRIGKAVQEVIQQAKAGNWTIEGEKVKVGEYELEDGEYELAMVAQGSDTSSVGLTSTGFVLLNLEVTEELEQEGLARDAIRLIQQARKDAGLDVSDRIWLKLTSDAQSAKALEIHGELVATETLATQFEVVVGEGEESIGENGKLKIELGKK